MKKVLTLLFVTIFGLSCYCCYASDFNKIETSRDAYDRRSSENYTKYKNNNYQAPLGGYNRPINDNGGRNYGFTGNSGFNSYTGTKDNSRFGNY